MAGLSREKSDGNENFFYKKNGSEDNQDLMFPSVAGRLGKRSCEERYRNISKK